MNVNLKRQHARKQAVDQDAAADADENDAADNEEFGAKFLAKF